MREGIYRLGIDIGSTTVKIAILDDKNTVLFSDYERHFANIRECLKGLIQKALNELGDMTIQPVITGSGGLTLAKHLKVNFVQELRAVSTSLETFAPKTDVAIELGGEDAKIIFFTGGLDERMNGSCAGGTGAFIDQMATLLNVSNTEMDELSLTHSQLYPIASRCGVFAKTDIQPLINQGATKADIAASIYQAVVNQTVGGLAQGRKISGKVMFLGGPLYYCKGLRERFVETLKLSEDNAIFPEYGLFAVAIGAALYSADGELMNYDELTRRLKSSMKHKETVSTLPPLV